MANKSAGLRAAITGLFAGLLANKNEYSESVGGKGHYYEGNIDYKASCRSSQSKRRKMQRRTGRY